MIIFSTFQSYYYNRADVALPNFASYFKKSADEALEHAQKFMKHQNDRGGKLTLSSISKPKKDEWGTALEGLNSALSLERELNQAVLGLHGFCDENDDYHSADFIEGNFLDEHVKAIKELTSHICNINRVGVKEIGEYVFERQSIGN